MNSLDDAPHAALIAHSHTDGGWKLVLVGKQRRCTHACAFCGHIWMQGSSHMYILREREGVCPWVCVYWLPGRSLDRGWSSYWWQYGAYRGGDRWAFLSLCCRKLLDLFHLPSCLQLQRSLQLDASPIHTLYQTKLQRFITTWMVAILPYTAWLLLASHSKSLARTWWANNSQGRRDSCFSVSSIAVMLVHILKVKFWKHTGNISNYPSGKLCSITSKRATDITNKP